MREHRRMKEKLRSLLDQNCHEDCDQFIKFLILPSYFFARYFICFVPSFLLLSGRSSINSSAGTV